MECFVHFYAFLFSFAAFFNNAKAAGPQKKFQQFRTPPTARTMAMATMSPGSGGNRYFGGGGGGPSREYYINDEESSLQNYILREYKDLVRPAKYSNETVTVKTRIFPMKIQELIEKDEVLHIAIRLQFGWFDKRLSWNPANFSGIQAIILPGHSVWIPDLQFSNSADDMYAMLGSRQFNVKVHSNGEVWWHPTGSVKLRCELDLQLFPYDHQHCKIILESVIYTHDQLNLTVRQDKTMPLSMYRENGLWELMTGYGSAKLNWATSTTAFSRAEFIIHIRRRSSYYTNNYVIPCFLLSCLQVLTFLIPLKNPERLTHATSVLLSLIVFQTIIFSELPKTCPVMPLLARYLMALSIVSVLAITSCVAVSYLLSRAEKHGCKGNTLRVPCWVARLLNLEVQPKPHSTCYDCSPAAAIANPVTNSMPLHRANKNGNGFTLPRSQHGILLNSSDILTGEGRFNCNHNCDQENNIVTFIKTGKLFERLAKQLDAFTFFICSVVILCVPVVLFVIAPSLLAVNDFDEQRL